MCGFSVVPLGSSMSQCLCFDARGQRDPMKLGGGEDYNLIVAWTKKNLLGQSSNLTSALAALRNFSESGFGETASAAAACVKKFVFCDSHLPTSSLAADNRFGGSIRQE